jgi:hypothetical protein
MQNYENAPFEWMVRGVDNGDVIDVGACPNDEHYYTLNEEPLFGVEYCDVNRGYRMRSIGRRKSDGAIIASRTGELYQHPDFECLWLL